MKLPAGSKSSVTTRRSPPRHHRSQAPGPSHEAARPGARACPPIVFVDRRAVWGRSGIMFAVVAVVGDRYRVLTDRQWELLELLLPKSEGRVGRNFCENRRIVEGMLYRLRTGVPWRDLAEVFGAVADSVETAPPLWHRRHL